MSETNNTSANRDFFNSAVLQQAVQSKGIKSIHGHLGVIEAAHWARLGVQVGYFKADDALQLLASAAHHVFDAWSVLTTHGVLPLDHVWAGIFQKQESGGIRFNENWVAVQDIAEAKSEFLQGLYQTLLLLLAENILDESSRYFLDGVMWTTESDWRSLMSGNRPYEYGNVQTIGIGLANVLNYWAEVESLLSDAIGEPIRRSLPPYAEIMRAAEWKEKTINPIRREVRIFVEGVQRIVSSRFSLDKIRIVERYFALAGEFVNRIHDNSPAWLDARLDAFQILILHSHVLAVKYSYSRSQTENGFGSPLGGGLKVSR
jgi:hypothetical protein